MHQIFCQKARVCWQTKPSNQKSCFISHKYRWENRLYWWQAWLGTHGWEFVQETWNNLGWKWSWRSSCRIPCSEQGKLWRWVSPCASETWWYSFLEFVTTAREILPTTEGLVTAKMEQPRVLDIVATAMEKYRERKGKTTEKVTSPTYEMNASSSRSHTHRGTWLSWVKQ